MENAAQDRREVASRSVNGHLGYYGLEFSAPKIEVMALQPFKGAVT